MHFCYNPGFSLFCNDQDTHLFLCFGSYSVSFSNYLYFFIRKSYLQKEERKVFHLWFTLHMFQQLELRQSKARSQKLLPGLQVQAPRTWAVIYCFLTPYRGSWMGSTATETRTSEYMGCCTQKWRITQLSKHSNPSTLF